MVVSVCNSSVLVANQKYDKLPEPLTLSAALYNESVKSHPDVLLSTANRLSALSDLEKAESQYGLDAAIDVSAGVIEPSALATDKSTDDHSVNLKIKKQLYDFGYTASAIDSAQDKITASGFKLSHIKNLRQIEITKNFYNVVLSDLKYLWDNEHMSMMFVRLDRSRDRFELKQISKIELLKEEAEYQESLATRRNTDFLQRTTRALLAESMNRPGELAAKLDTRILLKNDLVLKEPVEYISKALTNNSKILEKQNTLSSLRSSLVSAQNKWHPTLEAEVKVSEYSRELLSREKWRAGLNLHVPLFEGASEAADVSRIRAEILSSEAQLKQIESDIRKKIYVLWQDIQTLQVKANQLKAENEHALLALDKSRGEYDLEIKTNLGVSLANTTRVNYLVYKNKVDQILAWMDLSLLIGEEPVSVLDIGGRQ